MRRTKGGKVHSAREWQLGNMGMYEAPGDDDGLARHFGGAPKEELLHGMPEMPPIPMFADVLDWTWKSAYDIEVGSFTLSNSGTGTPAAVQDERGGVISFTNAATDNAFYYYFSQGEPAKLEALKGLWFRTRFKVGDVDQVDMFVGLCTKLASGNLFDNRVDSIGFYMVDGNADLRAECRKNGSAGTPLTGMRTLEDDTYYKIGFAVEGTDRVHFFVQAANGKLSYVDTIAANLPDDEEMAFAFGARNGQAAANSMNVKRAVLVMDE